jgi:hypothetical protein
MLSVQMLRSAAASTALFICGSAAQAQLCGFEKLAAGGNHTARLYFVSAMSQRDFSIQRATGESYSIHVQLGVFLDEHSDPLDRDAWLVRHHGDAAQGGRL